MLSQNSPARQAPERTPAPASATLYDVLEVSPRASTQVIKAAYRCLAQSSHPDKHDGSAHASARAVRINRAYAILSDPALRARYDERLAAPERMVERRGTGSSHRGFSRTVETVQQVSRAFAFRPF
jgi:DnaJ-class molecular chaperone